MALAVEAAGITAERAVAADHAMAGNEHRDMIVAIGGADRTNGGGLADGGRDLGITAGLPERNLAQLAPNLLLERRAGDIDRQLGRGVRVLDRGKRAFDQLAHAAI